MAVLTRTPRFQASPIRTARTQRERFPWYFEMNSATLFMVGVTLLSLTCLLYLLQTSRVAILGYEIQQVQIQQAAARREAENLMYEKASRESLPTIEKYARLRLKMKPVEDYTYVRVPVQPGELRRPDQAAGEGR